MFAFQQVSLAQADTVLARGRAPQFQCVFGDPVADLLHFGQFLGVPGQEREHDMEVAVADVTEKW